MNTHMFRHGSTIIMHARVRYSSTRSRKGEHAQRQAREQTEADDESSGMTRPNRGKHSCTLNPIRLQKERGSGEPQEEVDPGPQRLRRRGKLDHNVG